MAYNYTSAPMKTSEYFALEICVLTFELNNCDKHYLSLSCFLLAFCYLIATHGDFWLKQEMIILGTQVDDWKLTTLKNRNH